MAETAAEIVPLWEQWDAAGRPIPPCPACGGPATHTAWTEGYNEGGPIADCDATRCDCGLQIRGYATCADATNMSGFQWWLLAMRFERQAAEITRLQSGGCARDQTTTQYCAEAAKFAAEVAELRAEVERLRAERDGIRADQQRAVADNLTLGNEVWRRAMRHAAGMAADFGAPDVAIRAIEDQAPLPPAPESSDA